jgi:putative intracellular protease/amidase
VLTSHENTGLDVTLTSPRGGAAPVDPLSYDDAFTSDATRRFEQDAAAQRALANTARFDEIDVNGFDAVFSPGGYGQLWDLASDSKANQAIENWIQRGTPVAIVCHAPAILRDAKKPNGEPLVKGIAVTGFTDAEDEELGLTRHLLFSLEKALVLNGANFQRSKRNWQPNVVEDGTLITGSESGLRSLARRRPRCAASPDRGRRGAALSDPRSGRSRVSELSETWIQ